MILVAWIEDYTGRGARLQDPSPLTPLYGIVTWHAKSSKKEIAKAIAYAKNQTGGKVYTVTPDCTDPNAEVRKALQGEPTRAVCHTPTSPTLP